MTTVPSTPMTNRYAGSCSDCGCPVAAGTGTCARGATGRWEVRHLDTEACTAARAVPQAAPRPRTNRHPIACDKCGRCCDVGEASITRCLGDGGCPTLEHVADDIEGWHGTCTDEDACARTVADAQAERTAAAQRAANREELSAVLATRLVAPRESVAAAHPDSTIIELTRTRGYGMSDRILIEPADASPRRILTTTYRGADGDWWYWGNYGHCDTAYVMPYDEELGTKLQAAQPEPGEDHVRLTVPTARVELPRPGTTDAHGPAVTP